MATKLQISENSRFIQGRALQLFEELQEMEKKGQIKTQTEQLHEFYHRLHQFYRSIGRPSLSIVEARYLPSSKQHNQMMHEILQDLKLLYEEAARISEGIEHNFRESEAGRERIERRLQKEEDRAKGLLKRAEAEENTVIFHEGFTDRSAQDEKMTSDVNAKIWTREGVLTLAPSSATDLTDKGIINIDSGNGLPGNTKEAGSVDGDIRFIGEDSLHFDIAALLDSNPDTWMEYEHFYIERDVMNTAGRYGFSYQEGVDWGDYKTEHLDLKLKYTLVNTRPINWISVTPFIPDSRGSKPYELVGIELRDGSGKVYRPVQSPIEMNNEKVFLFGHKPCQEILFIFRQEHSYPTEVGHFYFEENEQAETNYLDRMKQGRAERMKTPLPSIESLGLSYNPDDKEIIYPDGFVGSSIDKIEEKKAQLFTEPVVPEEDQGEVKSGTELLPARRFMIGIRDIGVANYRFESSSEYISVPFEPGGEIVGVSLSADVTIPDVFPEGEWVTYSISPDNGEHWYRIDPRGTTKDGAKLMYLFNTNTPSEGRIPQFGYADIGKPVHSLLVRIEMKRPENIPSASSYTPVLNSYQIHAVRKGGVEE